MPFKVIILSEAEEDIFNVYQYIFLNDSTNHANYVFEKIEDTIYKLNTLPKRGHTPPELEKIGISTYREVHFKPYRIIYEIDGNKVFIHCVLDGRRDLQQLLERRLLRL